MCDAGGCGVGAADHDAGGASGVVGEAVGDVGCGGPMLHPLQQAWIDVQVPHCGYCQNGMLIQAADLLSTTKNPSEDQIRTAMNGHLCRCGTYPRILTAIQQAAVVMAKAGAWMMTGLLHEQASSRARVSSRAAARSIVGFSAASATACRAVEARAARRSEPVRARTGRPTRRAIDSWIVDQPRQHGLGEARQGRARPGIDDRAADDRRRGAEPGHQPDAADHERHRPHAEPGDHRRQLARSDRAASRRARPRRPPTRRCSGWPRRSSASRPASLSASQGRRHRRRQDRHLRRS